MTEYKIFLIFYLSIIVIGIIILTLIFSNIDSQALIIPTNESINSINRERMTYNERFKVNKFVKKWSFNNNYINDNEKIYKAIMDIINMAEYNENKYNPSDILNGSGNCQAYSLMFKKLMDYNRIECRIVINDNFTHMYTQILQNNQWIDIDLTSFKKLYAVK